jgi:Fic family protein
VSAQTRQERKAYYDALKTAQNGNLDYTGWLDWYLGCLDRALASAVNIVTDAMSRNRFWTLNKDTEMNARQRAIISHMLIGIDGKMTKRKWALMGKCAP